MKRVEIEANERSIMTLYEVVALALGYNPSAVATYHSTKISVAKNIADAVCRWYKNTYAKELGNDYKIKYCMEWLCYGPKAIESLPDNIVEVEDDFIELAS